MYIQSAPSRHLSLQILIRTRHRSSQQNLLTSSTCILRLTVSPGLLLHMNRKQADGFSQSALRMVGLWIWGEGIPQICGVLSYCQRLPARIHPGIQTRRHIPETRKYDRRPNGISRDSDLQDLGMSLLGMHYFDRN